MSKKVGFEYHELTNFADILRDRGIDDAVKSLMDKLVKEFLENAKKYTPVVTGEMRNRWAADNVGYKIRKVGSGYSVTLYNKAEYAKYVDEGHTSKNQYGGPYTVHHTKYPSGIGWSAGNANRTGTKFVIGMFIVDRALNKSEKDLQKEVKFQLQKWLDRCVKDAK